MSRRSRGHWFVSCATPFTVVCNKPLQTSETESNVTSNEIGLPFVTVVGCSTPLNVLEGTGFSGYNHSNRLMSSSFRVQTFVSVFVIGPTCCVSSTRESLVYCSDAPVRAESITTLIQVKVLTESRLTPIIMFWSTCKSRQSRDLDRITWGSYNCSIWCAV